MCGVYVNVISALMMSRWMLLIATMNITMSLIKNIEKLKKPMFFLNFMEQIKKFRLKLKQYFYSSIKKRLSVYFRM